MGRIVILGIDGLEYDLVEEWDLKYLKQRAYSKVDLSDFEVVVTPPIWAAMLTGKKIPEIEKPFVKRRKFTSGNQMIKPWYVRLGGKMVSLLPDNLQKIVKSSMVDLFAPNPFRLTYNYLRTNKYETLFDYFEKSWTNGIPSYGRNVSTLEVKLLMKEAIRGNLKPLIEYAMRTYEQDKKALFKALETDYNLIFWYTPFLDELSHFLIGRKLRLMNVYFDLNKLVKQVSDKLHGSDILYVISDHGMQPLPGDPRGGDHSNHGFFSSNTGEIIMKPQELFRIVVEKASR